MAAVDQKLPDGLHTRALNNGNVEFTFVHGGDVIASGHMTPEQLGVVVTNFLNSAHNAFHNADKQIDQQGPIRFQGDGIHVLRWGVGHTSQHNQQGLIIQVGDSKIGFIVPANMMRGLAAYLIASSYTAQSDLALLSLLRATGRELEAGLRGFGAAAIARFRGSFRRFAIFIWSKISGRSLRVFWAIDIAPGATVPTYQPIGKCIYCDASTYSTKPGIRRFPFGAEHIVPEGIGGTIELPEASCQSCEDATGRLVEGDALGRTLKALRVFLNLKKSGSGSHPRALPLLVSDQSGGKDRAISDVPIEIYPIAFMLPVYLPPGFSATATEFGKAVRGALMTNLRVDMKALYKKYGVNAFATAHWDNAMLCRMLAKIGHSLAVAELGESRFRPFLRDLISKGEVAGVSLVGCSPDHEQLPRSTALHTIGLGYQRHNSKTYVVASIRLFARYGSPMYRVVVGESIETLVARAKRILSGKITRILAR
jgi:hypothetical protein